VHLSQTLKTHGTAIVATFAPNGPERCSGLPAARYSPETLAAESGVGFQLVEAVPCAHARRGGPRKRFNTHASRACASLVACPSNRF